MILPVRQEMELDGIVRQKMELSDKKWNCQTKNGIVRQKMESLTAAEGRAGSKAEKSHYGGFEGLRSRFRVRDAEI